MNDRNATTEPCAPNISPRERRKRLAAGAIQIVIAAAALATMLAAGVSREWRLLLFFPNWGAAAGIFQALDKT